MASSKLYKRSGNNTTMPLTIYIIWTRRAFYSVYYKRYEESLPKYGMNRESSWAQHKMVVELG
jgi:hypothetical protein